MIRGHLKIFYDDLWCDLIKNQTGKIIKPFQDRCNFSWTKPEGTLSKGFKSEKPKLFTELDNRLLNWGTQYGYSYITAKIIEFADNRMKQGDYRYGRITRQNLNNYDTIKEFWRRLKVAKETSNLEYIVDMYNMLRIAVYTRINNYSQYESLIFKNYKLSKINVVFLRWIMIADRENWKLIPIDDGIHAEEK